MTHPLPTDRPSWLRRASLWLQQSIEGWCERRALQDEFAALGARGELDAILRDSGIAPSDTDRVLRAHPGTPRQLAEMMARCGIDRKHLPNTNAVAATLRETEWACGACADWRQCRNWLNSGTPSGGCPSFCPNAARFDELRAQQAAASETAQDGRPPLKLAST